LKKGQPFFLIILFSGDAMPGFSMRTLVREKLFFLVVPFLLNIPLYGQSFFPDTGFIAISQRCKDVRGTVTILNISLRPGDEDFQTLSYLRLERGCRLLSAYITNGELMDCDSSELYPHQLAALYRQDATSALELLGSPVNFLNLSDIAAYSSIEDISKVWPNDTLDARISNLIGSCKPDIILFTPSRLKHDSLLQQHARESILRVVNDARVKKEGLHGGNVSPWIVEYVLMQNNEMSGIKAPLSRRHPLWKKSYHEIGEMIYHEYRSFSDRRHIDRAKETPYYKILYSRGKNNINVFECDQSLFLPPSLRPIYENILAGTKNILTKNQRSKKYLHSIAVTIDSVDHQLLKIPEDRLRERRLLISWKESLEKLRTAMLGVSVGYSLDYSVVTERQLINIKIDTITNLPSTGSSFIVFPSVNRDWIVNESKTSYLPLHLKEEYRLLSPSKITYDIPADQYFQNQPFIHRPMPVIIVHKDANKDRSFIFQLSPKIQYSPRFTAEVLTPIIRCIDGEKLVVRLTNHSRDGVSDVLTVQEPLVSSSALRITLPEKESSSLDTLVFSWNQTIRDSSYLFPLRYGGVTVAGFLAKKIPVKVDSALSVILITGTQRSELSEALRRLGLSHVKVLHREALVDTILSPVKRVLIDRRALTLRPFSIDEMNMFKNYVFNGGHLVVFAQDAQIWNTSPMIDGVRLTSTIQWTAETPLSYDSINSFFTAPNNITRDDFKDWIVCRAYNKVRIDSSDVQVHLSSKEGAPFIVEKIYGKGKIVYIDLALSPQLMSIHEGAFRLLANIIAF
jgi:hypothetical protein